MEIKKMIFRSEPRRGEKTIAQGETLGVVSKANKPRQGRQIEAGLPPLPRLEMPFASFPGFYPGLLSGRSFGTLFGNSFS
ncbi:MAG: hypothetical protein JST85_29895 [Acidobacteria bacterium]|nr:hypothetical protein [Acidobacteriota bacterium]